MPSYYHLDPEECIDTLNGERRLMWTYQGRPTISVTHAYPTTSTLDPAWPRNRVLIVFDEIYAATPGTYGAEPAAIAADMLGLTGNGDMLDGNPSPLYEHDCRTCIYLGTHGEHNYHGPFDGNSDLYACNLYTDAPAIIARRGSDPPGYTSMSGLDLLTRTNDPHLRAGLRMARLRGLVPWR